MSVPTADSHYHGQCLQRGGVRRCIRWTCSHWHGPGLISGRGQTGRNLTLFDVLDPLQSVPRPHTITAQALFRTKMPSSTQIPSHRRTHLRKRYSPCYDKARGSRFVLSQAGTLFSGAWSWWTPRRESPVSEARSSPVLVSRIFIERIITERRYSSIDGQSQRFLRGTATARTRLTINVYPEHHALN